jgi:3-isopropylmalate/(R)-2-methylmalate dehydratase small subunit
MPAFRGSDCSNSSASVISRSIADIFFSNALKNGVVPVRLAAGACDWLSGHAGAAVEVDVEAGVVRTPGGCVESFAIDPFAGQCLLNGVDELGFLLGQLPAIAAWEARRS